MRVLKFGGTSVADAERVVHVARLIQAARAEGPVLVVVSAQAGVTDRLAAAYDLAAKGELAIEALRGELGVRHLSALESLRRLAPAGEEADLRRTAGQLHRVLLELAEDLRGVATRVGTGVKARQGRSEAEARKARILAAGERLSAPLVAAALRGIGLRAQAVDAARALVLRGPLLDAEPDVEATAALLRPLLAALPAGTIPVFTGFLGADAEGRVGLLGRGGSDTSATAFAAALGAERVEIYTDVDGILTADPRRDPAAVHLPYLTYQEAFALAARGAKVLHPKAVEPVERAGIPLVVRNTFNPRHPGTYVAASPAPAEERVAEVPAA
jgi:aspartokinase/homoserine dehydrogenase 1